jgi:hypothetical protein
VVVNASTSSGKKKARAEAQVDELIARLLPDTDDPVRGPIIRAIHQARSVRRAGEPRRAMAILAELQPAGVAEDLRYWVHSEWLRAARKADFPGASWLYTMAPAQAAVLVPAGVPPGMLQVATVIGLTWEPGRLVYPRTLPSLAPLYVGDRPAGGSP